MFTLLSTSDTDLLSARASGAGWRLGNPARLDAAGMAAVTEGSELVVVRILGVRRQYEEVLAPLLAGPAPVVVLGGEQVPDAELMELSTVPMGVATEAHGYLAQGGPDNLTQLHRFLSDTVLLTGEGFEPASVAPDWGLLDRTARTVTGPRVAVLYYRAHHLAGNTAFVEALCTAIEDAGGRAVPVFVSSLRSVPDDLLAALRTADALVVTVLAAGGSRPATAQAGGDDGAWDVGALAELDVPVVQGLCLTRSRDEWLADDDGLSPLDVGNQVAIPEFDGRLISVPFSFKETDDDGLTHYVADPERAARVAGTAVAHARLRHTPPGERRIVVMLSAYPTKHARIGNAVGLDTPASVVRLLAAMHGAGYDIGPFDGPGALPGVAELDGDALVHALIAAGGQDENWLTEEQLSGNPVRIPAAEYRCFFDTLPEDLRAAMTEHWGEPPGSLFVDTSEPAAPAIVFAALRAGNVVVMVQPPRGFGENPIAIYHDPDLPPSHHYLAAYWWLRSVFGAHALVHVGKHGNMEWLPGKTVGLSASCGPDAAIGDLPLVYPFLVNDPGEGSQAKRRAHATLVDHMVPPMARAESYGDIARLEQLLDEHANIAAMDPAKLPAVRAQIWTLLQAAKLDADLGLNERPEDDHFDEMILHVDGWLCEIKDSQIRDGLHVLGSPPAGQDRVDLVVAMLRARQIWGGSVALPGLREALGLAEDGTAGLRETDRVEELAAALVGGMETRGWTPAAVPEVVREVLDRDDEAVEAVLRFAVDEVVPRLARTTDELDATLHALDGGYVPAGPSGSPLRGLVNVLPTGRNFYSVDPRAVPSRLAWETGQAMADSLLERYRADTGEWPRSVGLSVWGTSAMRTSGDDVAEVLALLGVRPVWDDASRRVTSLEPVPLDELGRPRVDVTVRISGFFRDAFPHVVTMLDDAVTLVAGLDEGPADNFVRAHVDADVAGHGDRRRATTRVFGSKPGAYGAGLLPLIDSRNWRGDADLAEVYAVWGGYAYGRDLDGVQARPDMEAAYKRIAVAAKNVDTREHDIADSDDYFQYHGGMVATVRALTGSAPKAYIGDSTRPEQVRTRSLTEETARVFRARVVNPKWLAAMRRHGYKGAFELAATVDYLFGYDATTGVVADWMYEKLAQTYVLDPENREFMETSNPWALHGIAERLLEAVDRRMWESPDPQLLAELQQAYLDTEGDLEGGETPAAADAGRE
ncbi:cobaltochelatase CobN subunit [Blastococcus sp. DSM 46786]|uniref:cobaltochelatase subunit CobN n=1 Tax=Blastococcus sp. DSM 46786 TaxID=1798227 RepID=UPI0008C6DDF9|nr:cobaltochelatase subunit CobN [Blastococcus sp. DSM 46786]SEK65157.1 cobaltochelatase CobN subunit [Blastococcus sp. DSM 46786]